MIEAALDAAAFAFSAAYILNNPELSSRRMTKKSRTSFCLLFQPLPSAAALVFLFLSMPCAFAQAPAGDDRTRFQCAGSHRPGPRRFQRNSQARAEQAAEPERRCQHRSRHQLRLGAGSAAASAGTGVNCSSQRARPPAVQRGCGRRLLVLSGVSADADKPCCE